MEHKAPYAFVGFFICLCIAAIVGFTVWIQGSHEKDYDGYTVLMPDSVSGLEAGSQVLYRGIRVGKVEKLRLPPGDDPYVRVDIRMRDDVPVYKTTKAELSRTSLTGTVNLNITAPAKGDQTPPLQMAGEKYPIIEGQKSAIETALKDVPAITRQLRSFTGKANESLDDFRGSFVGKLMGQDDPDKEKPAKDEPRRQQQKMNLRN
ncbi:MAG TPA: MlaD family protein [Alphaproteobacteria bacterium]